MKGQTAFAVLSLRNVAYQTQDFSRSLAGIRL
jgi:hypothetical protein